MKKLIFGKGNAKLSKDIITFSLPAGYTCPAAHLCQSFAHRDSGKIHDGKHMEFRCFAASQEAVFPSVRKSRWQNLDLLKPIKHDLEKMAKLILDSIDRNAKYVRIHVSGDFFNVDYFAAWCLVAQTMPNTIFYAYTKSLHIVEANTEIIPDNLRLTLSMGGKYDYLSTDLGMKVAKVVFDPMEAEALGLEIDHDDSHAYDGKESFALLIHGQQKKGSKAAQSIKEMKGKGVKYSYAKK